MMAFLKNEKDGWESLHYTVANYCQLYLEQGKWKEAKALAELQLSRAKHLKHAKNVFFQCVLIQAYFMLN